MGALHDLVQDPARRRAVIDDAEAAVDAEVASKTGLTGLAVKAGFRTVKAFKPGIIPMSLDAFLDEFSQQIDPFYDQFRASGQADLKAWFLGRRLEIANALLEVTDRRARTTRHRSLQSAYERLRPQAVEHTAAAMPRVADLVQKHLG